MSKATNTVTFEWATTTNRKQGSSSATLSAYAADGTQNSAVDVQMAKWGTDVDGWVYLYTVYVNGVKRAAFAYADNGSIKLATMCKSPAAARRAARKFSERVAMGLIMDAQAAAIALVEEPAQAETVEAEKPAQATINKVENGYELDMEDKIVVFLTAPLAPEGNIREIPNWKYREQYAIFDSEDAAGVEMLRYIQRYGIETVEAEEDAQAETVETVEISAWTLVFEGAWRCHDEHQKTVTVNGVEIGTVTRYLHADGSKAVDYYYAEADDVCDTFHPRHYDSARDAFDAAVRLLTKAAAREAA